MKLATFVGYDHRNESEDDEPEIVDSEIDCEIQDHN